MTGAWGRIKGRGRLETMTEEKLAALKRYFEDHPDLGVASAYLFGSHAEGRSHRESDVDVGVLLQWESHPTQGERSDVRIRSSSDLTAVLDQNQIDIVILNDAPPLLGRKIIYDGVRVFCGDSETDHSYVRDIQIRAADLEPWLRKWGMVKEDSLK